jgi:hypothetical protein
MAGGQEQPTEREVRVLLEALIELQKRQLQLLEVLLGRFPKGATYPASTGGTIKVSS